VSPEERQALEGRILAALDRDNLSQAATHIIRGYGPEVLGFLVGIHGDHDEASETFAQTCEDLWRGLPGFARRSSVRTWLYTLARYAAYDRLDKRGRARRRTVPLSDVVSQLQARVRDKTLSFLKSETRSRLAELRATLPVDDQTLLILRLDKKLEWNDIARVMGCDNLTRESARLRKRYQLAKDRLRALAKKEGLL
jgi:RNA polymerase sigma-70 factor (ECF subfamily)